MWGDLQEGQSRVSNVLAYSASVYPQIGTRIYSPGIREGSFITGVDVANRTMDLSMPATTTSYSTLLRNGAYRQELYLESWAPEKVYVLREGAIIHLEQPYQNSVKLINTSKAIQNTELQPVVIGLK
jgi:hypothetical protein